MSTTESLRPVSHLVITGPSGLRPLVFEFVLNDVAHTALDEALPAELPWDDGAYASFAHWAETCSVESAVAIQHDAKGAYRTEIPTLDELLSILKFFINIDYKVTKVSRLVPRTPLEIVIGTDKSPVSMTFRVLVNEVTSEPFDNLVDEHEGRVRRGTIPQLVMLLKEHGVVTESIQLKEIDYAANFFDWLELPLTITVGETVLA